MKNFVLNTFFTFLAVLLFFSLQSCGSDSKKSDTNYIEGIWRISEETSYTDVGSGTSAILKNEDDNQEGDNEENGEEPVERPTETKYYSETNSDQKFLIFENLQYKKVQFDKKNDKWESTLIEEGQYSIQNNTISITLKNNGPIVADFEINNNSLTMDYTDHSKLKKHKAVRASLPELENGDTNGGDGENGDDDNGDTDNNGDDEDRPGCAARHQRDAKVGSNMNPKLIETGVVIDGILPDDTENGFLFRYYLEVNPYENYTVSITDIVANYDEDIHETYHFMEVKVKEEFITDFVLQEIEIPSSRTSGELTVNPATECMYITIFSFQESIEFKLKVTIK